SIKAAQSGADEVYLDEERLDLGSPFASRVLQFANLFRDGRDIPLSFQTRNTIPTAAGLASSASGFAALTKALCLAFDLGLSETEKSLIARLGSGSATRSFWHGFVKWPKGEAADGSDSHGIKLDQSWDDLRIAIVPVDEGVKPQSSRDGMNHTSDTSPLFKAWPDQAEQDCSFIERAIIERRFSDLGQRVEANALAMHATMIAARPPLAYLTEKSWRILMQLWQARREGLEAYATMDAGPNVKLIFLASSEHDVLQVFPNATVVSPFDA
ncbi:MAG: diphosphomevalonate decarboxylase, partial [Pseudomonadota bacterium]